MRNRFPNKACVLCVSPSVGKGEHVWPSWFIGEFEGEGPFTTSRGGVPYKKADKLTPVTHTALQGVHVPMCEACNSMLNRTIEASAKPVVRKILAHGDSADSLVLTADECRALAVWLLKVGILGSHPDADFDHPAVQRDPGVPRRTHILAEWLDWMYQERQPPGDFSVFVARRNLRGEDSEPTTKQWIVLPRLRVDGKDLEFTHWAFGLAGLDVTIVWHPGWPILHPQVERGRAVRIWPHPVGIDLGALPEVHPKELTFWEESGSVLDVSGDDYATKTTQPLGVETDAITVMFSAFQGTDDIRSDLKRNES